MTTSNPLERILGVSLPGENGRIALQGTEYVVKDSILRQEKLIAPVQADMADFYDAHWKLPGAYDNEASDTFQVDIFRTMFPDFEAKVRTQVKGPVSVLDVGCGSGVAGRAYFHNVFDKVDYVGVDMSAAIEQAKSDFDRLGLNVGLLQAELNSLPFAEGTFDYVFCPGVLHYTIDMSEAIGNLARLLKPGGHFVTWIYKKQKPVRQLTDDYLRSVLSAMPPEAAFEAVKPLTQLGIALGKIKEPLEVTEDIPYLEIKKGTYSVQMFFYYHIMKLFYNPELPFIRHNVNNWNAYYPKHVLFLDPDTIRGYFLENGFEIDTWNPQGNGIGLVAVKG